MKPALILQCDKCKKWFSSVEYASPKRALEQHKVDC